MRRRVAVNQSHCSRSTHIIMNLLSFRSLRLAAAGAMVLALLPLALSAQPGPLNYVYSYNASAYNDTTTLVAFNIEFSDDGLAYVQQDDGSMVGQLYTRLRFTNDPAGDPEVIDWVTAVPKGDAEAGVAMLGTQLIALAPGNYDAQIYYHDVADQNRRDSARFQLVVPSFAGRDLQLSDIIVANEASQSEDRSHPFFRNWYVVIPNVSATITPPFLVLNTYVEIYNADRVPTSDYHIVYRLADSARNVFYETQVTRPRSASRMSVELNTLPLDSIPSGQYYVVIKAYNGFARSATDSATVFRSFYVRNPEFDQFVQSQRAAASAAPAFGGMVVDPEYAGMKEEELDAEYEKIKPIMTTAEEGVWRGLDGAEPKGRFLTTFWEMRDPSPGTPENESRRDYNKRVEEARNLYAAPMAPRGWDSDRGRVLLKYGKADAIERHIQEFNRKPYEIWTYNQMSYQFVFIDRTQTGAFTLVHATAPGEVKNENWEQVATLNNSSTQSR